MRFWLVVPDFILLEAYPNGQDHCSWNKYMQVLLKPKKNRYQSNKFTFVLPDSSFFKSARSSSTDELSSNANCKRCTIFGFWSHKSYKHTYTHAKSASSIGKSSLQGQIKFWNIKSKGIPTKQKVYAGIQKYESVFHTLLAQKDGRITMSWH